MRRNAAAPWMAAYAMLLVAACGGGEEAPAPGTPANEPPAPASQPAASPQAEGGQAQAPQQAAGAQEAQAGSESTSLVRETFAYGGAGRDPFLSLIRTGAVRPRMEDLRLTAINYDSRYPGNSVAVLRDTTVNQRYTVRVGDELGRGRIRIAAIQADAVTVVVEQLGVERQEVLRLRRRQQEEE